MEPVTNWKGVETNINRQLKICLAMWFYHSIKNNNHVLLLS